MRPALQLLFRFRPIDELKLELRDLSGLGGVCPGYVLVRDNAHDQVVVAEGNDLAVLKDGLRCDFDESARALA